MSRVTDVIVEDCTLIVKYSDCTTKTYSIRNCPDGTPVDQQPGDAPPPVQQPDVRCRVALQVAQIVLADRYIDFLNAATPESYAAFGALAAGVVSAKLATYGWPALLYPDLYVFGFNAAISGDRFTALNEYNGNPNGVLATVQETLYCVLPANGEITSQVRDLWRSALIALGSATYTRLADFLGVYPLAALRSAAFEASITTDAVDCTAFDCGASGGGCGAVIDAEFFYTPPSTGQDFEFAPLPLTANTSAFPGFDQLYGAPNPRTFVTERTQRGWETQFSSSGSSSRPAGIVRTWAEPFTLCRVNAPTFGRLSDDPNSNTGHFANTRHIAVYIRRAGASDWTLLAPIETRGINNTQDHRISWTGVEVIDALAVIVITGGRVQVIPQVEIN